ncbi:MAG: phosphotransacetylase family protein [Chloroflexota bacterium]
MAGLYFTSTQALSGKSAICIALCLQFKAQGLNVGYMKPLGTVPVEVGGRLTDDDAVFVSRTLQLDDSLDTISPILLTPDVYDGVLRGMPLSLEDDVLQAYNRLSQGRDIVILEATGTISGGYALGLSAGRIAELVDARAVHVLSYRPDLATDNIMMVKAMMGDRLAGAIVNNIPAEAMDRVKSTFAKFLNRNGMKLFGALPADRILSAVSVRELADVLGGEILCCREREGDLVESFQVGAMNVDSALRYMMRVPNKAVIVGGDRADIQLAALQTSTKALVLTGNLYPDSIILSRATEVGVPVIVAKMETMAVVKTVEPLMGRIRVSHPRQVARMLDLVDHGVDLQALRQAVGI